MLRVRLGLAALGLVAVCLSGIASAGDLITGRASIIDGDTINIGGQHIRLFGIDAPEKRQLCENDAGRYACGRAATVALALKIDHHPLRCEVRDIDRYGRAVSVCLLGKEDLGAWMVRRGYAVAYRHYSRAYVPDEIAAREAHRGVWAGSFTMPWRWRHGERLR